MFRERVGCSVLEWCVHEVIGVKRVPVYSIVEICCGKDLLIGRNCRTISDLCQIWTWTRDGWAYILQDRGRMHQLISRVFMFHTLSWEYDGDDDQWDKWSSLQRGTHIMPWSKYVTKRTLSSTPRKWRDRAFGSGSLPSNSGNLGRFGSLAMTSQVAISLLQNCKTR